MTQPDTPDPLVDPFNDAHANSDVDIDVDSIHHTLGLGPQQAAPGSHGGHSFIGAIVMSAASSVPTKYLLCDGSAISRTTYKDLFAAIGTGYGAGDGSTTFNLPNFTNRFPRGNTLTSSGGNDSHSHAAAGGSVASSTPTSLATVQGTSPGTAVGDSGHGHNTNTSHSHAAANNIPAYTGIAFLIRYA